MKKTNQILIFIAITAIVGVVILLWLTGKKEFDWTENYENDSKEPFGTYVIFEMLNEHFPEYDLKVYNTEKIFTEIKNVKESSIYVYIGKVFWLPPADQEKLLEFAEEGNQVFIAANEFPSYLVSRLDDYTHKLEWIVGYLHDKSIAVNLTLPEYKLDKWPVYSIKTKGIVQWHNWPYFCFNSSNYEVLGNINFNINFIRFKRGKGYIYLHSTPILFSNYHLLTEKKLAYTSGVFKHLKPGDIYWDEGTKTRVKTFEEQPESRDFEQNSPLSWILSQNNFRYTWYLLLTMSLLYLIFRAKRRQPLIPALVPNTDTSLLFARLVGNLYLKQGNHQNLAQHKIKHFYVFVRSRYKLAKPSNNEGFINILVEKSGIEKETIIEIFNKIEFIEKSKEISEKFLIDFHNLLYMFYLKCK
ncbi:MAG: DUF4350 domain-containing protein [Bacteroidales bacterium]|nr:DUF4350 domain-containing protein [Bacteroidales bacterium]